MTTINSLERRPTKDEYFEYYETYISKVPDGKCLAMLKSQVDELQNLFGGVSEAEASVLHPPYTWTIKQVVGHLIDAERIFADRLHRFSCGETQPQPGMNQDPYVANHDYATPSLKALVDELSFCRRANLLLVQRLKPTHLDFRGTASGYTFSVRALVWILVGHIQHHLLIVRKRLGQ